MEEEENILTYTLENFQITEVNEIIDKLPEHSSDEISLESDHERLSVILGLYQEQSHLMDPYLEDIVTKLLNLVRNPTITKSAFHQVFKYLYLFTKVRGYKNTIRVFSHEVADLEFVLKLLKEQSPKEYQTWETRYILLLWLAIICIIPFDLSRLDGSSDVKEEDMILNRILDSIVLYLDVSDKCKDASAYLAAKFLTRPDVKNLKLQKFIQHAIEMLKAADQTTMKGMNAITGILSTLSQIFKYGRREDLLLYASQVFECVVELNTTDIDNTLIRKLAAKLVQRVGLVFLVPKVASWRYQRGNRSLEQNLEKYTSNDEKPVKVENKEKEDEMECDEDFDIQEEVEQIIEMLIVSLKDKDTVVRWTTAKGIGRITGRLPEELADEVLASLLELFMYTEVDGAWHGGCLAIAELGRRGLLLPSRLNDVVPIILNALKYDERRGSYSVGSHVRDAACYVCWSFARAYEPEQIRPFVVDIAISLLITTIFDREVNCRRAASAAFQENVGRQGTFPHGIDIVTTCDYFAVGNRQNCYYVLSVFIAKFSEYTKPLIDHLRHTMIAHWDANVREQVAHSFAKLTSVASDFMYETVLPHLLEKASSLDICTKHGAILAMAEVIHALYDISVSNGKDFELSSDIVDGIKMLVSTLRAANKFKGHSGELMRVAVCKLIEKVALSKIMIDDNNVLDDWLFVIEDTLPHTIEPVQDAAIHSIAPFFTQYVQNSNYFSVSDIIQRYCSKLKSSMKFERMGFALAIGEFLPFMLQQDKAKDIIDSLIECCAVDEDKTNAGIFAEARRNSVNSIKKLSMVLQKDCRTLTLFFDQITACLLKCTEDYTLDSRGDVGAWVREVALTGLCELFFLLVKENISLITQDMSYKTMCRLMQQTAEKIDRLRGHAGNLLLRMVHNEPKIPFIPHQEEIIELLPVSCMNTLNWASPSDGFPAIMKLLHLEKYQYSILMGFTISAGGLTESLVRASSDSLLEFLSTYQENIEEMDKISNNLLAILRNHKKNDRVIVPMLKLLDTLLSAGSFDVYNTPERSSSFPLNAFAIIKEIVRKCGDVKKLLASINVFCGFVPFEGDIRKKCLLQCMLFLCHKYPRIRKATAEQLYTIFVTYDDVVSEDIIDDITTKLVEVAWDDSLDNVRPVRNEICGLLGITPPKLKENVVRAKAPSQVDDLGYKDLVTRFS